MTKLTPTPNRAPEPSRISAFFETLRRPWVDLAASLLSVLCLIHCLLPPLLILFFPYLAAELELPESLHAILLALSLPLSLIALRQGLHDHGKVFLVVLGVLGQGMVVAGVLNESTPELEVGLTILGVVLVATTHVLNWRQRRCASLRCHTFAAQP